MAKHELDPGFEEVPLDQGFEEVPLKEQQSILDKLLQKGKGAAETGLDYAAATGQSSIAGLGDELGGAIQAGLDIGQRGLNKIGLASPSPVQVAQQLKEQGVTGDIGPSTEAELYRQGQQETEQSLKEREARSPIASTLGTLSGILTGASGAAKAGEAALGANVALKETLKQGGKVGLAKELGKRAVPEAIYGAAAGGGSSKGALINATPEEQKQLAEDVGEGAGIGTTVGTALSLAGLGAQKGLEALKGSAKESAIPLVRQTAKSFEEGTKGRGFITEPSNLQRLKEETAHTSEVTDQLMNAKQKLGQNIENTLKAAADDGMMVKNTNELISAGEDLKQMLTERPALLGKAQTENTLQLIDKLNAGDLDPLQANQLRRNIKELAFGLDEPETKMISQRFSGELDNSLSEVPGYKEANMLYTKYLGAGPETLISKGTPVEYNQQFMSDLGKGKKKVFEATEEMTGKLTGPGTSTDTAKKTFEQFSSNLEQFEAEHPGVLQKAGLDLGKLKSGIIDQADLSTIRRTIQRHEPHSGLLKSITGTSKSLLFSGANVAGKASEGLSNFSRNLFLKSEPEYQDLAVKLMADPNNKHYGQALNQALLNRDQIARNAALFAIAQNPNARQAIKDITGDNEEQQ